MNKMQNHKEITFAMQDRASSLMSIFKFIPKNKAKEDRPKHSEKRIFNNREIEIKCFDLLDTTDQAVLLAIIALAPIKDENNRRAIIDLRIPEEEQSKLAKALSSGLDTQVRDFNEIVDDYSKCAVVKASINRLLNVAGMSEGKLSRELLQGSLERLASTTYVIRDNVSGSKKLFSQNFLSFTYDDETGEVIITLNGIFTSAFNKQYSIIQLDERKALGAKNHLAQLIHSHFCATVPFGAKGHKFFCNTLIEKFMYDGFIAKDKKQVRKTVKASVEKIAQLEGWTITLAGKGDNLIFKVVRNK
jgi:hypothetical protein